MGTELLDARAAWLQSLKVGDTVVIKHYTPIMVAEVRAVQKKRLTVVPPFAIDGMRPYLYFSRTYGYGILSTRGLRWVIVEANEKTIEAAFAHRLREQIETYPLENLSLDQLKRIVNVFEEPRNRRE